MTQEEAYKALNLPFGNHFEFRKDEVLIDPRGILLVYDFEYSDWIHSRYESLQTEYVLANPEQVCSMDELDWHLEGCEPEAAKARYFAAMQDCERVERHRALRCVKHMQWYLTRPAIWLNQSEQDYVDSLIRKGYLSEDKLLDILREIDYEQLASNGKTHTLYIQNKMALQICRKANDNLEVQIACGDKVHIFPIKEEYVRLGWNEIDTILAAWNMFTYFTAAGLQVELTKGGNK